MRNEAELVAKIPYYYAKSLRILEDFGGPSVYFHAQAILQQRYGFMSERHIEMIYATLASWGLHRMGDPDKTKAKMVNFEEFRRSLADLRGLVDSFRPLKMDEVTEQEYRRHVRDLWDMYTALRVSASECTLVAHSKTLAHILPDLVPPIDRQYTVRFFTQDNKAFFAPSGEYRQPHVPAGLEKQFAAFVDYCVRIKRMLDQCDKRLFEINPRTFNTSYPKIMDNLIVAFVKDVPKPAKAERRRI